MPIHKNIWVAGMSIAPGMAVGRAFVYEDILEQNLKKYDVSEEEADDECKRIYEATEQVITALKKSKRRIAEQIGSYQADIFKAHQMILRELLQSREFGQEIKTAGVNAEVAVQNVFNRWVTKIQAEESTRFIQRAEDIEDLGRRLLRSLAEISVHPLEKMPKKSIVVANRLLPSDAVFFADRDASAIVVEVGGRGSHCALIIRQMGIPGICAVENATSRIATNDLLLIDAFRESIIIRPDSTTRKKFEREKEAHNLKKTKAKSHCHDPAVTSDGIKIPVMANVVNETDTRAAVDNGADGIGLYRLEGLFMLRQRLPGEQELLNEISATLAPLQSKTAMIRLLDIGSDKDIPYLNLPRESAPCLGKRGIRLLLKHPDLLQIQLRALLRLSRRRDIQIMVPMITLSEEMKAVRKTVESEATDLGIDHIPPLIAMIETPAAALSVPDILEFADGISLGTNDLTQYTMAAGRQNADSQSYYQDDHPAVLRLIRYAANEAGNAMVGICGELAGHPGAVPSLLDAGVRLLSVAPPLIPTIKEAVRTECIGKTVEDSE